MHLVNIFQFLNQKSLRIFCNKLYIFINNKSIYVAYIHIQWYGEWRYWLPLNNVRLGKPTKKKIENTLINRILNDNIPTSFKIFNVWMSFVWDSLFYCDQYNLFYGFPYNNVVSRYMYACIMCSMHSSISIILFIRFTTSDFLNFNWYLLQLLAYLYQISVVDKENRVDSLQSFIAQLDVEVLLAALTNFYGFAIKVKISQSVYVWSQELI